uniref:Shootin-1-like n=1 Tax=Sander lucioperca TaxID=283035 RepID=A0A8C9ZA98_SANLU
MQRDEANQRLSELEEVSNQLLKEINVLEMQFQIERSCRESAEVLAVKVTKENKVLKRKSQMLMPLIPELPENLAAVTFDPETDPTVNGDDLGEETLLLESQAKIAELQASVDGLLAEKLQLEQQVEDLTKEQVQLREQLALEVEEKEAILRKVSKQSKTMNKIKRVSQLVTEEFTEMSQKLEVEQGLRQHAEVFAHQVCALCMPVCVCLCVFSAQHKTFLKQLQDALNREDEIDKSEEKAAPAPPPPPPPPPPPLPPPPAVTKYTKAVDEMMERIKRGIVLRPIKRIQVDKLYSQEDDNSWKDQRSENRKSAIVELKGMLDNMKRQHLCRVPSRRSRNVGEAELLQVLQRRRRAMGENRDQTQGTLSSGDVPWAGESGSAPVLRRLKQNREKRDSRIRASALIYNQEN